MSEKNMSEVSITRIHDSDMKAAIEESLNLIGYTFRQNLKNIVIKINACYYWDHTTGQTTDPTFVASLIELIRERTSSNVNITLIESDASAMKCKYAFRFLGYENLSKTHNVKLVNLTEEKSSALTISCNGQLYEFQVPEIIQNADLRINLPKIKFAMKGIELTCALKNVFGCNPYPQKYKYHRELGNVIVALNKAMKFDLCIIDGNVVSGAAPRKLGLVMASTDPVALDVASAHIAGLDPEKIDYIKLAAGEGVGNSAYISRGDSINSVKSEYPKKPTKKKLMGIAYSLAIKLKLGKRLGVA